MVFGDAVGLFHHHHLNRSERQGCGAVLGLTVIIGVLVLLIRLLVLALVWPLAVIAHPTGSGWPYKTVAYGAECLWVLLPLVCCGPAGALEEDSSAACRSDAKLEAPSLGLQGPSALVGRYCVD